MQQEVISLHARDAWDAALRGIRHAYQHTWEHAYAMHLTSGHPTYLWSFRGRGVRAVCPFVERKLAGCVDIATPSGLAGFVGTGSWPQVASHWSRFVDERQYVSGYLGLHPLFEPQGLRDAHQHNSVYILDLELDRDGLVKRMDRNRRRQLRGWEERAHDFVLDSEAVSEFLAMTYEPFMRRVGARPPYLSPESLQFICRSDSCLAVASASSSDLEAAYVFAATPDAGECLINVATPEGRSRATDLLWYGVNALMQMKVPLLNLGGGVHEGDSVARAKQRFRPSQMPLRALRQVYRRDAYDELCLLVGVDPASGSGYFPAYRAPLAAPGVGEFAR